VTTSCASQPTSDAFLSCVGVPPRFSEAQVSTYADRVGAAGAPWIRPLAINALRANRLIYWKNTPGGYTGDCGKTTGLAPSGTQQTATILGQVAISDPEPFSAAIASFASRILGIFGGAHAKAVVNEQATLCDVANAYDQFADAMERALASGQIPLQDAIQQYGRVRDSLAAELSHIEKQYNAAYGYHKALDALYLFNTEVVYPSLLSSNPLSSVVNTVEGALGISPGSDISIAGFKISPILLAIAAVLFFAFRGRR